MKKLFRKASLIISTFIYIISDKLLSHIYKVRDNRILMISDMRKSMGGNFSYLAHILADRDVDLITDFVPAKQYRRSPAEFFNMIKKIRTSKIIILEDYFHYTAYTKLKDGQQICQLWHGAGAFKKFAYSRAEGNENIKIHQGYKRYSKVITSSEDINWCYAEAFGVDPAKVRATGIPDTDLFFDAEKAKTVKRNFYSRYPWARNKKLILFAPTYRADSLKEASYDFEKLDTDMLYNELSDEYIFALKWHPAVYEVIKNSGSNYFQDKKYGGFFRDFSNHRDINDLLLVCDVLVTDYSSVIFDYFLTGKPIVFFAYDSNDYKNRRGFYYDYEEYQYGPVSENTTELIKCIKETESQISRYREKRDSFGNKFMRSCDGHSSERVCRWILDEDTEER